MTAIRLSGTLSGIGWDAALSEVVTKLEYNVIVLTVIASRSEHNRRGGGIRYRSRLKPLGKSERAIRDVSLANRQE